MKAKALCTFRTKLRLSDAGIALVNAGDVIEGDDNHLRAMARNRLILLLGEEEAEAEPMKTETGKTKAPKKVKTPKAEKAARKKA